MDKKPKEKSCSESNFSGRYLPFLGILLVGAILLPVTLWLTMPFVICWYTQWWTRGTTLSGRKLKFVGRAEELFFPCAFLFLSLVGFMILWGISIWIFFLDFPKLFSGPFWKSAWMLGHHYRYPDSPASFSHLFRLPFPFLPLVLYPLLFAVSFLAYAGYIFFWLKRWVTRHVLLVGSTTKEGLYEPLHGQEGKIVEGEVNRDSRESDFSGKFLPLLGIFFGGGILLLLTAWLTMPFVVCWYTQWWAKGTTISGRKLRFEGKAEKLFLPWILLLLPWLGLGLLVGGLPPLTVEGLDLPSLTAFLRLPFLRSLGGVSGHLRESINFGGPYLTGFLSSIFSLLWALLPPAYAGFMFFWVKKWVTRHLVLV